MHLIKLTCEFKQIVTNVVLKHGFELGSSEQMAPQIDCTKATTYFYNKPFAFRSEFNFAAT